MYDHQKTGRARSLPRLCHFTKSAICAALAPRRRRRQPRASQRRRRKRRSLRRPCFPPCRRLDAKVSVFSKALPVLAVRGTERLAWIVHGLLSVALFRILVGERGFIARRRNFQDDGEILACAHESRRRQLYPRVARKREHAACGGCDHAARRAFREPCLNRHFVARAGRVRPKADRVYLFAALRSEYVGPPGRLRIGPQIADAAERVVLVDVLSGNGLRASMKTAG